MAASLITVSPRRSVADLERMALRRLEANGVAQLAARTSDRRQTACLWRVGRRLAADPDLNVTGGDHTDGFTYVTVFRIGTERAAGMWGEPVG